jgi:plasmid replication initiation protein
LELYLLYFTACRAASFWQAGSVNKWERPETTRPDPHPVRDFFIQDLIDYAPKDSPEMMERPFFSISKRKRNKAIEYKSPDGSMWIKVTAHPEHGMATIWDADIIIWCISKIVAAREKGDNDFGPTIYTTPYELLTGIARGTGGKDYADLMNAIRRLRNTDIETNIRAGRRRYVAFHYLEQLEGEGSEPDAASELKTIALTLPKWIFDGIMNANVLTLDREYFLLKGGLERAVYRIARKHAGMQEQGWLVKVETLHAKTGSEGPLKKFAFRMRAMAAANNLPGYTMQMTTAADGSPAIRFLSRSITARRDVAHAAEKQLHRHRDTARTAWIDTGRDPRNFEEAWQGWIKSGNDPAVFAELHRSLTAQITSTR